MRRCKKDVLQKNETIGRATCSPHFETTFGIRRKSQLRFAAK